MIAAGSVGAATHGLLGQQSMNLMEQLQRITGIDAVSHVATFQRLPHHWLLLHARMCGFESWYLMYLFVKETALLGLTY